MKCDIQWKTGILPTGDCFVSFENRTTGQHFEMAMDAATALEMGAALVKTGAKRQTGFVPEDATVMPRLIPLNERKPS